MSEIQRADMQLKGTDFCIDITCDCGQDGHVDGYVYYFKCSKCGQVYEVLPELNVKKIKQLPKDSYNAHLIMDYDYDDLETDIRERNNLNKDKEG